MEVIRCFPKLIDDGMNEELEAKISKEELKRALNSLRNPRV